MPLIVQTCIVVVTIALVVLAVMAVRVMLQTRRMLENANRSLAELPALIEDAKRMSVRVDDLLLAFSQITQSARTGVSRFENLATRTNALASTLLDEVERPIAQAAGLIRGIRAGANMLIQRWRAHAGSSTHTNQGDDYAGEQQWLDDGGIPAGSGARSRSGADLRTNGR
jgi:hypothetical protein